MTRLAAQSWLAAALGLAGAGAAVAESMIDLQPPPAGRYVLDLADLIDQEQEQAIETLAAALLSEHRTPLVVVTIKSMADHWPHGSIRIETFAHLLFDQWQIGAAEIGGEPWNTGILLLVSKNDRKARIQLGAGWGRDKDAESQRIMDTRIIPQFKKGRLGELLAEKLPRGEDDVNELADALVLID